MSPSPECQEVYIAEEACSDGTPTGSGESENKCLNRNENNTWDWTSIGVLISCGTNNDCGGVGNCTVAYNDDGTRKTILGINTDGVYGTYLQCTCDCPSLQCYQQGNPNPIDNDDRSGEDVGCFFKCECGPKCVIDNSTDPPTADCDGECQTCTLGENDCDRDEDCIVDICVDSGLCTTAKTKICDEAYQVISNNPNNRAKCCPATSGCVKNSFGVTATATCSNSCGDSCIGSQSNPGNGNGYAPSTYCVFGSRVYNMPECEDLASLNKGNLRCGNPTSFDLNSLDPSFRINDYICCDTNTSPDGSVFTPPGSFVCSIDGYGYNSTGDQPVCVDPNKLTDPEYSCKERQIPVCDNSTIPFTEAEYQAYLNDTTARGEPDPTDPCMPYGGS